MMFIQEIISLKWSNKSVINQDEYESIGTHWIVLYVNVQNGT